jgi:hypothetical protein
VVAAQNGEFIGIEIDVAPAQPGIDQLVGAPPITGISAITPSAASVPSHTSGLARRICPPTIIITIIPTTPNHTVRLSVQTRAMNSRATNVRFFSNSRYIGVTMTMHTP